MSLPDHHEDHPHNIARNARYGLWLFGIYVIHYGTFMYMSAFRLDLMASKPFGGVNLAILYGFSLIASAFVLAVIYMILCRKRGNEGTRDTGTEEKHV